MTMQTIQEKLVFDRREMQLVAGILSDIQEFADEQTRGKLNLVKGFLFGDLILEHADITFSFKSKNPNSRFCDRCGLLKVGAFKECECELLQ